MATDQGCWLSWRQLGWTLLTWNTRLSPTTVLPQLTSSHRLPPQARTWASGTAPAQTPPSLTRSRHSRQWSIRPPQPSWAVNVPSPAPPFVPAPPAPSVIPPPVCTAELSQPHQLGSRPQPKGVAHPAICHAAAVPGLPLGPPPLPWILQGPPLQSAAKLPGGDPLSAPTSPRGLQSPAPAPF